MHKGTNKKGAFSDLWLIESIGLLICLAVILAVVANASPAGGGAGNRVLTGAGARIGPYTDAAER